MRQSAAADGELERKKGRCCHLTAPCGKIAHSVWSATPGDADAASTDEQMGERASESVQRRAEVWGPSPAPGEPLLQLASGAEWGCWPR